MLFAIIILLFFVLDILVFHRFMLFGMNPLENLVSAIGFFTGITYLKNVSFYPAHKRLGLVYLGAIFILAYAVYPIITQIILSSGMPYLKKISFSMLVTKDNRFRYISFFLFVYALFNKSFDDRIYRYLLISICGIFVFSFCNLLVAPMPQLYLRYSGFLLLPVLFSWLMMLYYIIQRKYGAIEEITDEMAPVYQDAIKNAQ